MNRLEGKSIIVTGAANGIGCAVAERIVSEGGRVTLADIDGTGLDRVASEIRRTGGEVASLVCDAADPETGSELAALTLDRYGSIHGLVPCAGRIRFGSVREVTAETLDGIMNLNLRGVFFMVQSVANAMIARGGHGSIVMISSTSGEGARPNNVEYGLSKSGINYLTRTFALDLASSNIRVNAVSPGIVETRMWQQVDAERGHLLGLAPGELSDVMRQEVPMKRFGSAEEVASVIAFLLGDDSSYVTGQIITIDGGFMLNHA